MIVKPSDVKTSQLHAYLLGSVSPRPICFASTINEDGTSNLSPFSFFNVFGSKPPILIFSPARRVRDNTIKHTLINAQRSKEVVINIVNYSMVQQMSLASCEYPEGVSEFEKAGFTPEASTMVKAPRVKESPVSIECKVTQVVETGHEGGAGNLIICEVLCMHIDESILDENGLIDPHRIDTVARMGGDFYCRASGAAVFKVPKPNTNLGIGVDALPRWVRNSAVLTGNNLGLLGNSTAIPAIDEQWTLAQWTLVDKLNGKERMQAIEQLAKELLDKELVEDAWQVLLRH
jgi:flavin reductase (DIM6/NTAB) family NADH-FMN oxidoreductase RutF